MKHHFVGIVGFGGEGFWHFRKLEDCENLTLKGVYDISDKRRTFAREKGIYVYGTAEAMFCDKEIDIVIIATPNDSHKSLAIRAMRLYLQRISKPQMGRRFSRCEKDY